MGGSGAFATLAGTRTPAEDLARLRAAAADGRLEAICREHGLELLVLFGSAVTEEDPGDVDLAVAWSRNHEPNLLSVVVSFLETVGDSVDVMDLDRAGPVARQRALTGGELIVELTPHAFAERQMHAIREFIETAPFRRLDLELMAR